MAGYSAVFNKINTKGNEDAVALLRITIDIIPIIIIYGITCDIFMTTLKVEIFIIFAIVYYT